VSPTPAPLLLEFERESIDGIAPGLRFAAPTRERRETVSFYAPAPAEEAPSSSPKESSRCRARGRGERPSLRLRPLRATSSLPKPVAPSECERRRPRLAHRHRVRSVSRDPAAPTTAVAAGFRLRLLPGPRVGAGLLDRAEIPGGRSRPVKSIEAFRILAGARRVPARAPGVAPGPRRSSRMVRLADLLDPGRSGDRLAGRAEFQASLRLAFDQAREGKRPLSLLFINPDDSLR